MRPLILMYEKELLEIELLYWTLSGRRDSEQRHSIRGCMDLVMLEHGNEEHHLRHDISSIQVTFLPEDFLPCC